MPQAGIHDGHRERMEEKRDSGGMLLEHEILEMLLFAVFPRINTNPIAHALLDRFMSIDGIFSASKEELKSVDGIGDRAASFLVTVGMCSRYAQESGFNIVIKTFGDCKDFVRARMHGKSEEFLELYFLDKRGKVARKFSYTSLDINRVDVNAEQIVRNIALYKPHGILVAHNHLNNSSEPSGNDDMFTKELQLICNMNNVNLWDHLIYSSDDNIFSYRDSEFLEKIKKQYSLENAIKWIKNSN